MLDIQPISPAETGEFARIWIPWLESTGRHPEPEDLAIMADPAAYYRATGGEAFLAKLGGATVGAVAVKGLGASGFEFCKLVVSEAARWSSIASPTPRRTVAPRSTCSLSARSMSRSASTNAWVSAVPRPRRE